MPPGPKARSIVLTTLQEHELGALAAGASVRLAKRAEIILACSRGQSNAAVARQLRTSARTVRFWRERFADDGIEALRDAVRTGRPTPAVVLTREEREELCRYVRRGTASNRLAQRSRIILACAEGGNDLQVATSVGVGAATVGKWRRRFIEERVSGLHDHPRPGGPRKIGDDLVEQLIARTLQEKPKGATHWSTRRAAKVSGMSSSSVGRVWRALGLKPHRTETFQLSTDPDFIDKVRDVVGLYMSPPDNAIVLCVDEKTQIQALNRTQPLLPLARGQVARHTPEYRRNGTTSLFAALNVATGGVIGNCYARHRTVEFCKFLNEIRRNVPVDVDVHMIVDNYATHSAAAVKRWLAKNPRFHIHFIPTHSSWLNMVEGWFSVLTTRQLKRGSHHSVEELESAIQEFLDSWNEEPTPFKWTKSADQILANVAKHCFRTLGEGRIQ